MNFLLLLFKFLKKNKVYNFEELLKKAANEPSSRDEFIKRILTEKLVVITNDDKIHEGYTKLEKDTQVSIFTFEDGRVPIFTSTDRILDKGIIKQKVKFLAFNGRDLFNMVKDKTLILNPYSNYGKEFIPEEIERILSGTYFNASPQQIIIEKTTEVRIGQPSKYPVDVVKALAKLFSNQPDVIAGYLAWIHDPATNVPPHYIFAIDTMGDYRKIVAKAGNIVQDFLGSSEIFDFIQITRRGGLDDYFLNSTEPFYKRA